MSRGLLSASVCTIPPKQWSPYLLSCELRMRRPRRVVIGSLIVAKWEEGHKRGEALHARKDEICQHSYHCTLFENMLCPLLMRRINPNCGRVDLFRRFIPLPTNNSSWVDQRQIGSYSVPPSLFSAKVHSGFSGGRELCAQFSAALPSHGRPLCKIRLRVWNT